VGAPRAHIEAIAEAMLATGFGGVHTSAIAGLAIRDLAEGHYADAYERLLVLVRRPFLQVTYLQLPDFVESAARCGHLAEAGPAVQRLSEMAQASGSAWAASVAARSRALISPDEEAEPHYRHAIDALHDSDTPVELGRAHLLYGEWLRRVRRRRDAGEQLRTALDLFERAGTPVFAARARSELAGTGARLDLTEPRRPLNLTPQEATVAQLAAQGHTNAEIGATLFISANTVDYHLRKVFQKLGITSRRQLADRIDDTP
jgi:DNA-binding CsgD family transcriptional regulator